MLRLRAACPGLFACLCLLMFAPPAFADLAPPGRGGPFRSCGSGLGLALAGVGMAWGLMWVGHRHAGRAARK